MPIVEMRGVSRIYRSGDHILHALDNVDLSIDAGKFVVILGQSGNYGRTPCHAQPENRLRVDAKKPGEPGFLDTGFAVTYSAGRMFAACLPFGPVTMSKVTFWFSARVLKPLP